MNSNKNSIKFFEKKVKYFKFFEDSKIIEIDQEHERLAIVFFGKENLIHIFDAKPYINYQPIQEKEKEEVNVEEKDKAGNNNEDKKEKEIKNIAESQGNSPTNLQEIFNNLTFKVNENVGKTICTQNQEYIMFNSFSANTSKESNQFNIENFNFQFESLYKKREITFDLYKPKVKTQLLSIINSPSNVIIGFQWFCFKDHLNTATANNIGSLTASLDQSNALISIYDDGNIIIYSLKCFDYDIPTTIDTNKLQSIPFLSYPEEWKSISQVYTGKPIKDFYMAGKGNKIYTLHIDNFIMVWIITYVGIKLTILANYAINITPDIPLNKILIDKKENFVYAFYNHCFKVFKIMNKPPFPLMFNYEYEKEDLGNSAKDFSFFGNMSSNKSKSKVLDKEIPGITPIKIVNGMDNNNNNNNNNENNEIFEYEIHYNDIIDRSELMRTYDITFFNNVQKAEFTLLERHIVIPFYSIKKKKYILFKFDNKVFRSKILSDFNFFNQCANGLKADLMLKVKISDSQVNFSVSPFLYLKFACNNEDGEAYSNYLEEEIEEDDLIQNLYQPVMIINEGLVSLLNFDNVVNYTNICEYKLNNAKMINPDFLTIVWTTNNTILLSSTKIFMNLIKFAGEAEVMGIPVNAEKVAEMKLM